MRLPISACLSALLVSTIFCPPVVEAQDPGGAGNSGVLQAPFSIEDILSPGFPYDLVSARSVDRIAWLENKRGVRNVYTAAAPGFRPVQLTTYTEDGVDLSNLQISDDGEVVLFIRGHAPNRDGWVANPSSDAAGAERAAWAVGTAGGRPWRVVETRNARLSPDGGWALYTRDGEVYRAAVNPGLEAEERLDAAAPLFRVYNQASSPIWSPDSRRIAFVTNRGSHSFIGVYHLDTRRITYMVPGVDRDSSPVWSPDGQRIVFVRRPGQPFGATAGRPDGVSRDMLPPGMLTARFSDGHDYTLWIADATTGEGRELWRAQPGERVFTRMANLTWAGDHLVFRAQPGEWPRYYSISVNQPQPEPVPLTPDDGLPEYVAFSSDGQFLYYATNYRDIDRRHIWRVPTAGGRTRQVTTGDGIETFPAVLASGRQVAVLAADARRPLSVALAPSGGGAVRMLTYLPPQFPLEAHVVPENVVITAPDGLEFHNQLFLPPDLQPGEQRPALLFIHGGPRRQMLLGYNYGHFYHMAYAIKQYHAVKGYVVLSVNFRSGIGYGRSFRNPPRRGRSGNSEYQDILAAGRYLQDRPDVDPERVGLWGLSYGGLLTAQGLARNSDVFAAGADIAGVHLWGNTLDPENTAYRSSPVSEIESWTSPVLLIHADDDRNVAFSQTVGLVQLLRANEVPFELIVFPDDVHSFLLHDRWLISFNAMDDFFRRTLVRGEAITTTEAVR